MLEVQRQQAALADSLPKSSQSVAPELANIRSTSSNLPTLLSKSRRPEAWTNTIDPVLMAAQSDMQNSSSEKSSDPEKVQDQLEDEYAKYLKRSSRRDKWRFGSVGAGIGGLIGFVVAPVVAVPVALAVGGASGFHLAKMKRVREVIVRNGSDEV